jgi:hypothetical protein
VRRRTFLRTVAGSLLAAALVAEAQPAGKGYRIGLLEGPFPPIAEFGSLLVGALYSAGYVEGRNAIIERGMARADQELTVVATALARSGVDVIVAAGLIVRGAGRKCLEGNLMELSSRTRRRGSFATGDESPRY